MSKRQARTDGKSVRGLSIADVESESIEKEML